VRALAAFAVAVLVFHHAPALAGDHGDWVDLVTPFAVVGAAAWVLVVLEATGGVLVLALAAAIAYVDGHGLHLAANSIRNEEGLSGEAERVAYFWDEEFSHVEWHVGLLALMLAFCLAERAWSRPPHGSGAAVVLVAVLLGFTLFTSGVEGHTWWLMPPALLVFGWLALTRPGPVVRACAGALALMSVLLAIWAVWHRGVPEFSDLGWI
jgi:hypothetical protein